MAHPPFAQLRAVNVPRLHRIVLAAAVVVYGITAWNSAGYHAADEHYQLIAFAQWKNGELPPDQLAWEFREGIRSSLQPWAAAMVFRAADAAGAVDPFTKTRMLRLLTAMLSLLAIHGFVRAILPTIGGHAHKAFILLAYLLWFLPFLHVRFSSEGWAGIFIPFMLTRILQRDRAWAFKAGLFAGLAMACRPPTGLIVLSSAAWMMLVRRDRPRHALVLAAGAALIMVAVLLLDHAFYGTFTPTFWNYLRLGFIGDPAHRFDALPWYYYPPWIVKYALPPVGAAILGALILLAWGQGRHLALWCALPYLAAHTLIAHKELRFLHPLADLVPWILVSAWAPGTIPGSGRWRAVRHVVVAVFIIANLLGLSVVMTSPAGEGRTVLAMELHKAAAGNDRVGYLVEPAMAWRIALPAFYLPPGTMEVALPPAGDAPIDHIDFLVAHPSEAPSFANRHGLVLQAMVTTEPRWAAHLLRWYTWQEGPEGWTLYRVEKRR